MKKSVILLIVLSSFIFSCIEKNEDVGALEVTVLDSMDDPISGKYLYLFDSEDEMNKEINGQTAIEEEKSTTDNSGYVFFNQLEPIQYWVLSSFENLAGGTTYVSGTATVVIGKTVSLTIKP